MDDLGVLTSSELPTALVGALDTRDVALWIMGGAVEHGNSRALAELMKLPWSVVLTEATDEILLSYLEEPELPADAMVRRRGLIHVIDTNPTDVILPPRCLPVYLLNGRNRERQAGLAALTRRLTMLEDLRRRSIKHLVVISDPASAAPSDLTDLWEDGFRAIVTFISDADSAGDQLLQWKQHVGARSVGLVELSINEFSYGLVERYRNAREGRIILRLRDASGELHRLDVTGLDDPEHPIIGRYELLSDDLLLPLLPEDLRREEIEAFFSDPSGSWRPFAAGVPWRRDEEAWARIRTTLRALDYGGVEESRIFYVQSESGAGATTFVRDLAWRAAELGYPTLVAGPVPFKPNGVEVAAYLTRTLEAATAAGIGSQTRLYQAPWLCFFDRQHWEGQEDELTRFARELERSGRRACIVFVTGPYLGLPFISSKRLTPLSNLTHQIDQQQVLAIGRHLNRFLKQHGNVRTDSDWRQFYEASAIQAGRGIAAFWIALSFWVQRQFDMSETVQSWIYRQFRERVLDEELREAIIRIAALSTVHHPLPDALLPATSDWPISDKLGDIQKDIAAIGLIRVREDYSGYWMIVHDLIGRYLLTALFYDHDARVRAGFGSAENPEHLRFLALRDISELPILERADFRDLADIFAVSIFKIDPDHGHATFAPFWREALRALDEMPRGLRTTSRTFLHHTAISRRRIAKDADLFQITNAERAEILNRATSDIEMAITIPQGSTGDTDLSLYNSLAHAYHDLAEAEATMGSDQARVAELQGRAREATRKAYQLNPDNSFVTETYARDLLSEAKTDTHVAARNALEVLALVYSAMDREGLEGRQFALARLADTAFDILLEHDSSPLSGNQPRSETEAIIGALSALARNTTRFQGMELGDYPVANRQRAAELLADRLLSGNAQAVRLRYLLACLDRPLDFGLQLELLQSLSEGAIFTPQMRLEFAILLHQRDRHHEAEQLFRSLRRLWQQGEHFVEVPRRLRWLLVRDKRDRRQVHARVVASGDGRYFAKVRELSDVSVLFRPHEFGQETLRPGTTINGYISFWHNGPFLRPLTASI